MTQQLINWMADLQKEYAFDGVRIDTVPYVNQTFWHQFQQHGQVVQVRNPHPQTVAQIEYSVSLVACHRHVLRRRDGQRPVGCTTPATRQRPDTRAIPVLLGGVLNISYSTRFVAP